MDILFLIFIIDRDSHTTLLEKKIREHLQNISDLDEQIIQDESLHWCTVCNLSSTKWRDSGQWKPKSSTHCGLDSKSHQK